MSHYIHGFVSTTAVLQSVGQALPQAQFIPLSQGLAFMPFTEAIKIQLAQTDALSSELAFDQFETLTQRLAAIASSLSAAGPLAYVETEYFGGLGTQSAIVWTNGVVVLGPLLTDSTREGAINQALSHLGVVRSTHLDEFDAIGLGRYHTDEDWIKSLRQA